MPTATEHSATIVHISRLQQQRPPNQKVRNMIQSIQNFGRGGGSVGGGGTEGGGETEGGGGTEGGRGTEGGTSESLKLDIGQTVVYSDGQKSDMAKIKSWEPDNDGRRKSRFKIEFPDGSILDNVHKETLSLPKEVDPVVERVIGILNLRVLTDQHFRAQYPTLKEFEEFFLNSTEEFKAEYKRHGKWKEPLFKRSDTEEFILLSRWIEKNEVEGKINWDLFNKESFNNFRKQAPKDDLFEILKELGIYNEKVVRTLKAKNVLTPAHFVQKPKSWFDKLGMEELGTEENSNNLLFNGTEKYAIEKFRDWYSYRFVGYLPSDWIVTFRNDDVHPKERELRKVLRVIGLSADPVRALKMNDIRDITALNRTSKEWRTENRSGLFTSNSVTTSIADRMHGMKDVERDSRSYAWKHMGLTRNDASDIITFRHWYNFYVSGKKNTKGWAAEFNSTQYRNFIQRYEPGDNFNYPNMLRSRKDKLRISQEKHEYYDMLKKATEAGDVSEERRYHLLQYLEKREKMSLIEEITSQHDEGLAENSLQASRLKDLLHRDEKEKDDRVKNDLLFYQGFCQFFFSAFLVLTLLGSWIFTTAYLMSGEILYGEDVEDNEYLTFIHNVVFGLVTAVVIQELGEEAKETSLYYRFLGTYREQVRRSAEYRYRNQLSLTGFRGKVKRVWNILMEYGKTRLVSHSLHCSCYHFAQYSQFFAPDGHHPLVDKTLHYCLDHSWCR